MPHNGNRGQINLFFLAFDRAFAFIDHLKSASLWSYSDNSGRPDVAFLNARGLPKNLNGKGWATNFYIPRVDDYSGNWIIDWVGECTVGFQTSPSTVAGSNSGVNGKWTVTLSPLSTFPQFRITAINEANPPTQIRIYRADHEVLLLAGEVYTPLFLEKMSKYGVIRPMDYQLPNTTNIATWADNTPIDYFSYACSWWDITRDAGSTSHSGDAYSCTPPVGFTRTDKCKLHVKWDFTNTTTSPTFDDGGGALPILTAIAGTVSVGALISGRRDTLTYDEGLNSYLSQSSLLSFDEGILAGVPPAILVRLANDTGAHLDWAIPPMACDTLTGITDYAPNLATLAHDTLSSGLRLRPQIGNELFNTASGFHCAAYATAKGTDRWGSGNPNENWHGRALSLVGAAFAAVYNDTSRYDIRMGVQSVGAPDISSVRSTIMEATKHVIDGGAPASDHVTHVCPANYWASRSRYPTTEAGFMLFMADAWEWRSASPTRKLEITNRFYSGAQDFIDGSGQGRLEVWWGCAQHYGKKVTFYEGGNSEDGIFTNPRQRVLGISKAANAVFTMPSGHGWRTGMKISPKSIEGMTEINDVVGNILSYDDTTFTTDIDSTGFSTFTNGTGSVDFSAFDPTLRGVAFVFAEDGTTNGRDTCNEYLLAVAQSPITYLYSMKNLRQHISLADCEFPSHYHFCGDGVFSNHPPPGYIYTQNPSGLASEHFSTNKVRMNLQCVT